MTELIHKRAYLVIVRIHDRLVRVALGETLCAGLTVDVVFRARVLSEVRALHTNSAMRRQF